MISREREREREEKENLSSLKIYARVFLYETTHLSYGDADLRYRVFRPFRCTLYSHSYLLYFTSRRRITSVCFNNEEIKISCVCVVLFFLLSPVFFFFDCFFLWSFAIVATRRMSKIRSHRRAVKRILRIVLRSFSFTIKERPRRSIYTEYFNAKYNSHPHTNAFKRKNNRSSSSSSSWEEETTTKSTSTKTKE